MSDEEYQTSAELDEYRDAYDQQLEQQEALIDSYDSSIPQQKETLGLFNLFWKIFKTDESTKVAFLDKTEVGPAGLHMRGNLHMANLCNIANKPLVAQYFKAEAEIVAATSMGRDGKFAELFVSQKKSVNRSRKTSALAQEGKKWIFKKPADQTSSTESD